MGVQREGIWGAHRARMCLFGLLVHLLEAALLFGERAGVWFVSLFAGLSINELVDLQD